jgi:nitrogen-specific signal transduction histidine kinase
MSTQFDNDQARQENVIANNDKQVLARLVSTEGNHNLAENKEAVLTLLENGMILNCNKAGADLLGCESSKLAWQPISRLLPQLADLKLVLDEKINPYLKFLSIVGHRYEVVAMNGAHFACELFFSDVEKFGKHCLRLVMQPIRQGQPTTLRHLRTY